MSTSTSRVCLQCGTEYGVDQRHCPKDGSALQLKTTDDPLIGKVIADRYHIQELIGVGGMGRVYLAEHVALGRKSAFKVISPSLATSAEAITRFNREAANASRINHPNVAQIYDFGESEGVLYLAMEFIDGEALATTIERLGPMSLTRAAGVATQVSDALAAAHQLGIVHRDLKPENIMIGRRHDGGDWVKVVDFGIAKTVEHEHGSQTVTTAGVSLGTPEYMSPEQFAGEKLDHRTDIYSLGLVTFNMLTGELPYPKVTSKETLVRRLTSKPRPLSDVRPDVGWPAGLQTALDRALAPEARDRYGRVTDFGQDVARAAGRGVEAPRRPAPSAVTPTSAAVQHAPESPASEQAPKRPRRPRPTVTPDRPRRRVLPILLWLLLIGGGGAAAKYQRDIARMAGLLPATADDTTAIVEQVADPDPIPDVSVIPQGEPLDIQAAPAPLPTRSATSRLAAPVKPPEERRQSPMALHHPWLRANGDSTSSRDLSDGVSADELRRALLEELQGHLALAARYTRRGDVGAAHAELRDASEEARGIKLFDPALAARVDLLVRDGMREAMQSCQAAKADTLNPLASQMDCGSLFAP